MLFSRRLRRSRRGMQQGCIISQRKTVSFEVKDVLLFWGFVCVNLRDQRETLGLICANRLSTLAFILPQITQMTQRNAAKLHYIAEKDRLFEAVAVIAILLFWVSSA